MMNRWLKSPELKELERRLRAADAERHPNVPQYAITTPAREDKTANGLQRCIIDFLELEGWQAERINVMGRPIFKTIEINGTRFEVLDKWIRGQGDLGSADLSATINGRSVKIEVKIGQDRQSADQERYQMEVERAGGLYFIARNFADFQRWYLSTNY